MNKELIEEIESIEKLPKNVQVELMSLAQAGDEIAKHKLVKHNLSCVVYVVKSLNKKKICHNLEIDELFSIGTEALYKAIDKFNLEKSDLVSGYMIKTVFNSIINEIGKDSKGSKINTISLSNEIYRDAFIVGDIAAINLERKERDSIVKIVINNLTYPAKQIVERRYYKGQTVKEVAVALDEKPTFISSQYAKTLKNIRKSNHFKTLVELKKE